MNIGAFNINWSNALVAGSISTGGDYGIHC